MLRSKSVFPPRGEKMHSLRLISSPVGREAFRMKSAETSKPWRVTAVTARRRMIFVNASSIDSFTIACT